MVEALDADQRLTLVITRVWVAGGRETGASCAATVGGMALRAVAVRVVLGLVLCGEGESKGWLAAWELAAVVC